MNQGQGRELGIISERAKWCIPCNIGCMWELQLNIIHQTHGCVSIMYNSQRLSLNFVIINPQFPLTLRWIKKGRKNGGIYVFPNHSIL